MMGVRSWSDDLYAQRAWLYVQQVVLGCGLKSADLVRSLTRTLPNTGPRGLTPIRSCCYALVVCALLAAGQPLGDGCYDAGRDAKINARAPHLEAWG